MNTQPRKLFIASAMSLALGSFSDISAADTIAQDLTEARQESQIWTTPVNSVGTDISDSWITTKVKSTYMYSSNVDSSQIEVSTNKGVVSLSGKVESDAERTLAIELAQNIKGVESVQAKGLLI